MSVQYLAFASQKCTCPGLTALPPAVTFAVSVTAVPDATMVTGLPAALIVSDVTVAVFVSAVALRAAAANCNKKKTAATAPLGTAATETKRNKGFEDSLERKFMDGME